MTPNSLILIVDDDPDFLEILQAKLESQGFSVTSATNGSEAIEKAKQLAPAAVLMDIEMPIKDGITAAAELASDPITKTVPTIFVTNLSEQTAQTLAAKVAVHITTQNYFRKDGDYNFLLKRVQSLVAA